MNMYCYYNQKRKAYFSKRFCCLDWTNQVNRCFTKFYFYEIYCSSVHTFIRSTCWIPPSELWEGMTSKDWEWSGNCESGGTRDGSSGLGRILLLGHVSWDGPPWRALDLVYLPFPLIPNPTGPILNAWLIEGGDNPQRSTRAHLTRVI